MFEPKYTISHTLLSNIKRIAGIIAGLNSQSFSGVILSELERRAREVSAFSSTSIEGNPLPLTDVKRILKTKPEHIRDSEQEVLNYNKALVDLNSLMKDKAFSFDLPLILKIQKTITQDLIDDSRCGQLRREPVFVNDPRLRKTLYLPPDQSEVEVLMKELFDFIKENEHQIDPLILAGIFHKQFVIIHPFIDGNGRTARLATKVLLAKMGLDIFNLFSFENYYNKNVSKYFEQVGLLGNYYDIKKHVDYTSWLEYFTDGVIDELLRVAKELNQESSSSVSSPENYREKIIRHIKKHGLINARDYARLTDRAKSTRSLDLKILVKLGIIERFGQGRATYYKLKK